MSNLSLIESTLKAIDNHPLAGAMLIVLSLIVHQILLIWKKPTKETVLSNESNKLTKQTNEAINVCAQKSLIIMEYFEKHLHEDNIGHISTNITKTLQMLEEMDKNQIISRKLLVRIIDISDTINSDLKITDSRMAHVKLLSGIEALNVLSSDIKRITIHIAEKKEK